MESNDWSLNIHKKLLTLGFTGKMEVNIFMGGVSNINLTQSIKQGENIKIFGRTLQEGN